MVVAGDPPYIVDRDSANGVHVDGLRAEPGVPIAFGPNNVVELGDSFLLLDDSLAASAVENVHAATLPPPSTQDARVTRMDILETAQERVRRLESSSARWQRLADVVATTQLSVLVTGEPSTGRATLAKRLHRRSPRAQLPFVSIDCAALEPPYASSLDPLRDAGGGSALLENVSELPAAAQAELMSVLGQPSSFEAAPAARLRDVRLLATTTRDLRELVAAGEFRLDLYLRLRGVQLHTIPLRERRGELTALAHQFLVEAAARAGAPVPEIKLDARVWLERHAWPGNLLELRLLMERALPMARAQSLGRFELEKAHEAPPLSERYRDESPTLHDDLFEPERATNPYTSNEPFFD